jgi:hypothetical protein
MPATLWYTIGMSKKHFEQLAAAIAENLQLARDAGNAEAQSAVIRTAGSIARACCDANPRFDDRRFMRACGIIND